MSDDFAKAKELCDWYKRMFLIAGVWPLESAYVKFTFWTVYCSLQVFMDFVHLLHVWGKLDMILTLGELVWVFMVLPKLIVLRFSKKLSPLLIQIFDEMSDQQFGSVDEKDVYLNYNRMAKTFTKFLAPLVMGGIIVHYFAPLVVLIRAVILSNGSVPIILPYRTHIFFDMDSYTMALWWIYQIPAMFLNGFHPASMGFEIFLIFHACGQLSALAVRIRKLGKSMNLEINDSAMVFRRIVEKHRITTGMTKDINDVFNILILEELFLTTLMIILTCHTVIVNADFSDTTLLVSYAMYAAIMFTLIFGSCVAGQFLIIESTNVYEAYYECHWYDLPETYKKQLIICMIGASKPLHLVGGGFYIFSLPNFTNILKTSMSYVSLLRTLM